MSEPETTMSLWSRNIRRSRTQRKGSPQKPRQSTEEHVVMWSEEEEPWSLVREAGGRNQGGPVWAAEGVCRMSRGG